MALALTEVCSHFFSERSEMLVRLTVPIPYRHTGARVLPCPYRNFAPPSALMFCLEYLEQNLDWLEDELSRLRGHYLLIDCPGQAELYTHHSSFFKIVQRLQSLDFRVRLMVAV
jgi:hypothetical protein